MCRRRLLSVLFVIVVLHSGAQPVSSASSLSKEQKAEVVHNLAATLKQNYVYLDTANAMAAYIEGQFQKKVYDSADRPGLLAAALSKDLWSVYHDGHLRVRYDPRLAQSIGKTNEVSVEDKKKITEYNRRMNFGFRKIEILAGNIGYLKFNQFTEVTEESKEVVRDAFHFLQHVDALIIDLRENGGGEPAMIQYICNYLFSERTHLNDIYVRRENTTGEFWTNPDRQLTSLMKVPVYVLTSKATFSGAEEFAYDLQTQKRAVVVGEITGGGAHPVEPRGLSNGFVVFVPFARAINPITKTNWEGKGVQPDTETTADQALKTALEQIKSKISISDAR